MPADGRVLPGRIVDAITGLEGVNRRGLFQTGGLAGLAWNLSLPRNVQAFTADARDRVPRPPIKSCILIFLNGGPSHLDTFDMKPHAPAETRGEFQPISTSLPGCQVCEHLPKTARQMHRLTLIRNMQHRMR